MKGKIVRKEIVHNLELTDDELQKLAHICKYYTDNVEALTSHATLCDDIIKYAKSVKTDIEDTVTIKEDVQEQNYSLLDNKAIYIKQNKLLEEYSDCDVAAYIGKQNQMSLAVGDISKPIFINKHCTVLLRDFIDRLGEGTFRGYCSYNSNKYFELDLYINNEGNTSNQKSFKLRYYYSLQNTPFGIIKDGMPELKLNYTEAQILSKFISRHF